MIDLCIVFCGRLGGNLLEEEGLNISEIFFLYHLSSSFNIVMLNIGLTM